MTAQWLNDVYSYLTGEGAEREFERAAEGFTREIMRRRNETKFSYGLAAKAGVTLLALKAGDVDVWNVFLREHVTYANSAIFAKFKRISPAASPATERFDRLVANSRTGTRISVRA